MKDTIYYMTQTPQDLAKLLIKKVPMVKGDMVWEPFAGEGAFYNHFPNYVHKDWCEIEKGRDFFTYHRPVDWVVTCPPFRDPTDKHSKSYVWSIIEHLIEKHLVRKGMALLVSKECYMSLTPLRLQFLQKFGFTVRKHVICNLRAFRGRFVFVIITKDEADFSDETFEPYFDFIIGRFPEKPPQDATKPCPNPPPPSPENKPK